MSVYNSNTMTRRDLALVVIFTGVMLFSTISPLPTASAAATGLDNVQVEAVSPIQKFALSEWTIPTAASGPYGVGVDTNGKVWFTENTTNKIARFDPTNNNFTEWTITTPNSQSHNVFVKRVTTGNTSVTQIFFTEFASSKIARFDSSTNNLTQWALASGSNPAGIYVDENNDVWFAESGRDAIGRLTPSTGQLTEWTLPGASSTPGSPSLEPWSVYVQVVPTPTYSNRFVWFTETLGNKIGRLEVTSNRLTIWDLGSLGAGAYQPNDLTIGIFQTLPVAIITDGNNRVSILGNDTGGGSLYQETNLPSLDAGAMGLTYDSPRNAAWFAENNAGNIANLNTTNVLAGQLLTPTYCTIAPLTGSPSCSSPATMLSSNITSTVNNLLGTSHLVSPAAPTSTVDVYQGPVGGITEYRLPSVTSRPTSVSVDSMGNVWFTENNVTINRIGRLSIPYVFQLSASPSTQTIHPGQTATFSLNITLSSGYPQPLQLSLLNTPSGVTAVFNPQSQSPPFTSTLTFTTTNSTPTGTFPMTVQAVSAGETQTAAITLSVQAVPPPVFDFSINVATPTTETVTQGDSASFSVVVALVSGSAEIVNLTASGFPSGANYSFTNPSGIPTFSSTINIFTTINTPGGTYPITITGTTSAGLTHTATPTPVLTITELPRDFNLSAPVTQVVLVQSSRTDITLTVTSIGYFNGNVSLSGSFSPSSGLTVTFNPSAVILESGGAIAQATMEITASKNTVGTYQFTVTATSTTPSRSHQLTISVRVSPCIIATATYGSELAPQVQFLRDFRDRQIMNTFAGSNFMTAFNAWYYSFSPAVAQYELQTPAARSIARTVLYPLMGILGLSELTFVAFGSTSEFGALVAGLLAGALIGLTYLALPVFCILWPLRRRISATAKGSTIKTMIFMFTLLLVGFALSEMLALPVMMMVSSAGLVLAALAAGSLLPAILAAELKRTTKAG
jgi:streptogramin lyase